MDEAKPDAVLTRDGKEVNWTESFIEELKDGLMACRTL